jgi:hypothetical protein
MRYVEALADFPGGGGEASLFLAGGISGCPDWQADVVRLLAGSDLVLLNPRRGRFPLDDPRAAEAQIVWEHAHLRRADAILFWFPAEALCPIALYELGAWNPRPKRLFVGCHPGYARRQDVVIQTRLERPGLRVADSLAELVGQVLAWRGEAGGEVGGSAGPVTS